MDIVRPEKQYCASLLSELILDDLFDDCPKNLRRKSCFDLHWRCFCRETANTDSSEAGESCNSMDWAKNSGNKIVRRKVNNRCYFSSTSFFDAAMRFLVQIHKVYCPGQIFKQSVHESLLSNACRCCDKHVTKPKVLVVSLLFAQDTLCNLPSKYQNLISK